MTPAREAVVRAEPRQDARASVVAHRWIISRRDDLAWIVGSVAVSYAFLAAYFAIGVPVVLILLAWVLFFDGPHIFATISRTFLDREERARRGTLLYTSLLLFAIGPLIAVLPALLSRVGSGGVVVEFLTRKASIVFIFAASMWAYHHIVMQHYGFMVLYKKKNDDLSALDNRFDRVTLFALLVAPFVYYMLREPEAVEMWPWTLPAALTPIARLTTFAVGAGILLLFIGRQWQRVRAQEPLNWPKLLFLAAVVPMHWVILLSPLAPRVMVPILTVSHNVQYERLVWFYNRNKYGNPARAASHGAASFVSRSFARYYLFGVLFALYRIPNVWLIDNDVAVGFFWGFSLVHYYLDSKIWKVRHDPRLTQPLKLAVA